jgi:hypothetical protein
MSANMRRWHTLSVDTDGPDEDGFVDMHFSLEAVEEGYFCVTVSGHGKSPATCFVQAALAAAQQLYTAAGGVGKLPGTAEIIPMDDTDLMPHPPSSGRMH